MDNFDVYKDIQARTGGEIYIGVVGPVREVNNGWWNWGRLAPVSAENARSTRQGIWWDGQ